MTAQMNYLENKITSVMNVAGAKPLAQEQLPVKITIVTVGEVLGMIMMVLSSIIESIRKAGDVGLEYLKTALGAQFKSAEHRKESAQDKATGSFRAAVIGIGLTSVGMVGSLKGIKSHVSNANKMKEIQRAPIAEPPRNIGTGVNGGQLSDKEVALRQQVASNGDSMAYAEQNKMQDKAKNDLVLHGKNENATSYSSEAERERALKIQEELNNQTSKSDGFISMINSQTMPIGQVEEARKNDDAAKSQHAGDVEAAENDGVKTLENDNKSFYGSLSGMLDKLGITNVITQAIIAASQWK